MANRVQVGVEAVDVSAVHFAGAEKARAFNAVFAGADLSSLRSDGIGSFEPQPMVARRTPATGGACLDAEGLTRLEAGGPKCVVGGGCGAGGE